MTVRREYVGFSLLFLCFLLYLNAGLMEEVYKRSMYFLFFFFFHTYCIFLVIVTVTIHFRSPRFMFTTLYKSTFICSFLNYVAYSESGACERQCVCAYVSAAAAATPHPSASIHFMTSK